MARADFFLQVRKLVEHLAFGGFERAGEGAVQLGDRLAQGL